MTAPGGAFTGQLRAGNDAPVRIIAFYLPQYHPIPENDAWWGEGFTEWVNVRGAKPNFVGHAQPHVPGALGYYDLRDPAVREAQAALARTHGIDAFCYYHYWFAGKRLLERPLDEVLSSGAPDFPFCICWANENWTRRWDGRDEDVLIGQRHTPEDNLAFIRSLHRLFRDDRYVRVDGRPLLLVYKIADIPDIAGTVAMWREECRGAGIGEIYLAAVQRNALDDPTPFGFDAAVEFPPIGHVAEDATARVRMTNPQFRGMVFDYRNLVADYLTRPRTSFRQFRGVTPMWDNTARRQNDGMILSHSSPEVFQYWLEQALRQTRLRHRGDERLLFINAWNEWAEGNHLEPDERYGSQYLEGIRAARVVEAEPPRRRPAFAAIELETAALAASGEIVVERFGVAPSPKLSIVMPVYNHARFLGRTLASLAAQTRLPDELVAIDDGSSDHSAGIIATFARSAPFPVTLVRQPNAGADRALNRGMAIARGDALALINSDDMFAPRRLERMLASLSDRAALAFSDVEFIDDDDAPVTDSAYVRHVAAYVDAARHDLLPVLTQVNVAVSTGNLVLRRALLERVGGFAPLKVVHDWDFVLASTYVTRVTFVQEPLYRYRLHGANTFSGMRLEGHVEGDGVLHHFFERIHAHPWLADPAAREAFLARARRAGLAAFIPDEG